MKNYTALYRVSHGSYPVPQPDAKNGGLCTLVCIGDYHFYLNNLQTCVTGQGYEQAGADCLYVPLPGGIAEQARICASTSLPVNALAAGPFTSTTHKQFADIGVARISLGSALASVTHRAIHDAAVGMFEEGDFSALRHGMSGSKVDKLLGGRD